jgi:hypothetical protein
MRDLPEVSEAMLLPAMIRFMLHRLGIPVASACPSHDFPRRAGSGRNSQKDKSDAYNPTTDEPLRPAEIAAVPRRRMFAVWCTYSTADEHMERWLAGVWEDEAEAEAAAERARRGSDPYGRGPDQYGPTAVVRAIPLIDAALIVLI